MSADQGNEPPAGEEIHLPGPSLHPVLLAFGLTVALLGITTSIILLVAGSILSITVIALWIRDTRRDIAALPAEH